MKNMDINKLKRSVKYGKIPLKLLHNKGDHMFTGLKYQLEITDTLIDYILPQDNELIKLKKVLNWEKINNIYKECFPLIIILFLSKLIISFFSIRFNSLINRIYLKYTVISDTFLSRIR